MRRNIVSVCIAVLLGVIPGTVVLKESLARDWYFEDVNAFCPSQPLTSTNCSACHGDSAGYDAFFAGEYCYFCPDEDPCITGPTCTDLDQDDYAQEGGDCGPVDCDDLDEWVNPGEAEDCTDGIDNNCNGLVDAADPNAVDCPPECTDGDRDDHSPEGGACGPVDCDDADASVNPGAVEDCTDGIDNNCNGLVDASDSTAVGCVQDCTDADGDRHSPDGGDCGPVDCDDADASVNPGAVEDCTDGIDNDCNGLVDAADSNAVGCPVACTDLDQDGYAQEGGDCGPVDCDDADESVHPGAREVCTDGIDNSCNGKIDRTDKACKKQGKQEECDDEDDGEECDDEERDSGERDDEEDEDGDHERDHRRDHYSEEQDNVRDSEALAGAPTTGCAMIPESMGHASPGRMFFMYSLVAGYIGIVRTLVKRKAGDRKDRFPGTGKELE